MIIVPTEKRLDWAHAPLVLISLVIINIAVFFTYQSDDGEKYTFAMDEYYDGQRFYSVEWPEFQEFLKEDNDWLSLNEFREADEIGNHKLVIYNMLERKDFHQHLQANAERLVGKEDAEEWITARQSIVDQIHSMSHIAQGLDANHVQVWQLISHQFLHGGIMHLAGNMVFLILCGFAVEAAIGHWRFLALYLLSGISGGLFFALTNSSPSAHLVGASGAISGVMAMYLGIFRLKKIEFFYWLFVFVGYIRLPALLVLPFYIGMEIIQFLSSDNSNVAFMAHVGGFVAGALSIAVLYFLSPTIFNYEYIEEDQSIDPKQDEIAAAYKLIERLQFTKAGIAINTLIQKHGETFDLVLLRYHMFRVDKGSNYEEAFVALMQMRGLSEKQLRRVATAWKENDELHSLINDSDTLKLAMDLSPFVELKISEDIFHRLHKTDYNTGELGILSRKISLAHQAMQNRDKQRQYERLADQLLNGESYLGEKA